MKWLIFCVLIVVTGAMQQPVYAMSIEDVTIQQEETAGIGNLEQAAKNSGSKIDYGTGLEDGLKSVLDLGRGQFGEIIKTAVQSAAIIAAVILFCGIAEAFGVSGTGNRLSVVSIGGTFAVTAIAIANVNTMLGLGRETIERMTAFVNVLFPAVATITAATGSVTGAAAKQMAATLFSDLLINLIGKFLVPLLYGYLALSAAYAALGNEGMKKMAALIKWLTTTVLTVVMLAFVGYLALSGVVTGNADALAIKTTKFAISGAIPVVGGILSDAAETIVASAGILRGSVGIFGTITILAICVVPLLRLAVHYLTYKFVSAVVSTVDAGRVCVMVDAVSSAFGMMMGMLGACCLLLLVALVASVTVITL